MTCQKLFGFWTFKHSNGQIKEDNASLTIEA